jgi:hypothetical protein
MAMRTTRWLWRLRHNPLRRPADSAETWLVFMTAAAVTLGAPAAGLMTAGLLDVHLRQQIRQQTTERQRTTAVLTADAPAPGGAGSSVPTDGARAPVHWTAQDGSEHAASVDVRPGQRKGSAVTVWTDRDGRVVSRPLKPAEARSGAIGGGVAAATGACVLLLAARRGAGKRLERHCLAEWDREWAEVGPRWTRHQR